MNSTAFNIWSVLILLGAVHGVFLGLVLWRKKENRLANRLFAALLFSLSYHLLEYAIDISGIIIQVPYLWLTSYPCLFVIGPLFYLYVKSLLESDFKLTKRDALHFIPAGLVLLVFIPFYLQSNEDKIALMYEIGESGFTKIPTEQFIIMISQITQICIYLYFSYQLIQHKRKAWEGLRSKNMLLRLNWLKQATSVFGAFMLIYAVVTLILLMKSSHRMETDYLIALLMASLVFVIGYVTMAQPAIFDHQLVLSSPSTTPVDQKSDFKAQLETLMEEERPFLREELKLADVAQMLELPAHQFSDLLRKELQISFPEFLKSYRIAEAKRLLSDPQYDHLKILAVALESGFGNKATFNRVFKEKVGTTPSTFRSQFQK